MKIKFLVWLAFVQFELVLSEFSFALDEKLQTFREDFIEFQSDSMVRLDQSFFKFYSAFYSSIKNNIAQPLAVLGEEFKKSCNGFPILTLESYAARRLTNMCDEVIRLPSRVESLSEKIMTQYYPNPETLTSKTLLELIAEDYFGNVNKYFEYVVPVYNQNPTCVIPFLRKFLSLIKAPIDEMIKLNTNMEKNVNKALAKDFRYIERAITKLFGVSNIMKRCSNDTVIDTFDCMKGIISFNCAKSKSGCGPVYKSIYITYNHFRRLERFYEIYEASFSKVDRSIYRTDASLLRWSILVDKCIV